MKRFCAFMLSGLLLTLLIGCQSASDKGKDKIYDIKGKVVTLEAAKKTVTLDHEDIPGFMNAMEMKFKVEDAAMLDGLKAGDPVQGKLKVTGGDYIITALKKK